MKKPLIWFAALCVAIAAACSAANAESNFHNYADRSPDSSAFANNPIKVFIMNVVTDPLFSQSITIRNNFGEAVDISHWTLGNSMNPTAYVIPPGPVMNQGDTRTFAYPDLWFKIGSAGETIFLKDSSGNLVDSWSN